MCNCIRTTIPLGPPAFGRPGPSDNNDDDDDDNNDDDDTDADLDWVSDVLPGGDEGHADEEDDEGGSVVKLERKVVNRSRIRLPGRKVKVNLRIFCEKVKVDLMKS